MADSNMFGEWPQRNTGSPFFGRFGEDQKRATLARFAPQPVELSANEWHAIQSLLSEIATVADGLAGASPFTWRRGLIDSEALGKAFQLLAILRHLLPVAERPNHAPWIDIAKEGPPPLKDVIVEVEGDTPGSGVFLACQSTDKMWHTPDMEPLRAGLRVVRWMPLPRKDG